MAQEINFIGRIDIPRSLVSAKLVRKSDQPFLELVWDFSSLSFSGTDELILDLEFRNTTETDRKLIGILQECSGFFELNLSSFRNPKLIAPRLKVVRRELDGVRKHVGVLDRIEVVPFDDDPNAGSLLKIVEDIELRSPWELRMDSGVPILYVTGREDLFTHFRYDLKPYFEALVLPEVVRQIYIWLASNSDFVDLSACEAWEKTFARFQVNVEELKFFRKQCFLAKSGDSEDTVEDVMARIGEEATRVSGVFAQKEDFLLRLNDLVTDGAK